MASHNRLSVRVMRMSGMAVSLPFGLASSRPSRLSGVQFAVPCARAPRARVPYHTCHPHLGVAHSAFARVRLWRAVVRNVAGH